MVVHSANRHDGTSDAIRAEALFASTLQPSEAPSAERVRAAVTATLRRLGAHGCAGHLAGEFGDHPDTSAARMTWAVAAIRRAYPAIPAPRERELAPAGA